MGYIALCLAVVIPVILLLVAFVRYMNVSGIYTVVREARKRQVSAGIRQKQPLRAGQYS